MNSPTRSRIGPLVLGVVSVLAVVVITAGAKFVFMAGADYDSSRVAVASAQSEELQNRANTVFEAFNGTPAQRNASGLLQAWALNGQMDICMESEGFPEWDWSATRNGAPRTNALDVSLFFAPPLNRSYSSALRDIVDTVAAEERLRTQEMSDQEDAAVTKCIKETPSASDEGATEASTPAVAAGLRNEWWSMLASWDERYGDVDSYDDCFADGAHSLAVRSTVASRWEADLTAFAPGSADIPPTAEGSNAGNSTWREFLAIEDSLEAVDWACRSQVYEQHLNDVDHAISEFLDRYGEDIELAKTAWQQVEEGAATLSRP